MFGVTGGPLVDYDGVVEPAGREVGAPVEERAVPCADTHRAQRPVVADQLAAAIGAVRSLDLAGLSNAELLTAIGELHVATAQLDAAGARLLAAVHGREATTIECGRGVRSWLIEEQLLTQKEAGRRVAVARALTARPELGAAFDAGEISFEHARVIVTCLRHLPDAYLELAEKTLVEAAKYLPPDELGPIVAKLREAFGEETAAEREQRRFDSRWVRANRTFDGMLHLEGMLDPEGGETLLAALHPLMATTPEDDDRSREQLRADALVDLARQSMAHGGLPDHGGDRPHVTVTVNWDALRDSLTDLGAATIGTGIFDRHAVTAETARRLACDAQIIPAVLGGAGQVLDLGRSSPTWTVAQRRAAALRDGGCVWPGCRAGLDRCQLHHLDHWAHLGPTNIENSAYLCHYHHWLVHHRNWTVSRDPTTHRVIVRRT